MSLDNMRLKAGLGRELAGVEVVSANAFLQRQKGSLYGPDQPMYQTREADTYWSAR